MIWHFSQNSGCHILGCIIFPSNCRLQFWIKKSKSHNKGFFYKIVYFKSFSGNILDLFQAKSVESFTVEE